MGSWKRACLGGCGRTLPGEGVCSTECASKAFTQGPWSLSRGDVWAPDCRVAKVRNPEQLPCFRKPSRAERAANARLIAAGPSLYLALDRLLASCGARGRYHALKYADAVEQAEAALALAAGTRRAETTGSAPKGCQSGDAKQRNAQGPSGPSHD